MKISQNFHVRIFVDIVSRGPEGVKIDDLHIKPRNYAKNMSGFSVVFEVCHRASHVDTSPEISENHDLEVYHSWAGIF